MTGNRRSYVAVCEPGCGPPPPPPCAARARSDPRCADGTGGSRAEADAAGPSKSALPAPTPSAHRLGTAAASTARESRYRETFALTANNSAECSIFRGAIERWRLPPSTNCVATRVVKPLGTTPAMLVIIRVSFTNSRSNTHIKRKMDMADAAVAEVIEPISLYVT